jgi:hypothetical protein
MHRGIAKGAAVVGTTAALIGGGAALANAASGGSSSTPSNTQPSNPAPSATPQPRSGSGHHCPHMGSGGNSGSGFGAPQSAPSQAT